MWLRNSVSFANKIEIVIRSLSSTLNYFTLIGMAADKSSTEAAGGSLGRRVHQIVQMPLDGDDIKASLEAFASLCGQDNSKLEGFAHRQRDLRTDIQERGSQMDQEFVQALSQVNNVFAELEQCVDAMDQQCLELRSKLNGTMNLTMGLSNQASLLTDEQTDLTNRQELVLQFIDKFTLTDSELQQLGIVAGSNKNVAADLESESYFDALDKLSRTREEWHKLHTIQQQSTATAVDDVMQDLAGQETQAYENLLKWVMNSGVRELTRGDTPEFSSQLKRALQRLRPHAALFDAATGEIAQIRCESLGRAFINALVRGGPRGTAPRPIEAHAADPLRYIGDMLAWVHQACASEKELLDTLFGAAADEKKTQLLALSLENISRPLEIRVEQTVAELKHAGILYRIDNLLSFYRLMFNQVASLLSDGDSGFMATVQSLCETTHSRLLAMLDALVNTVISDIMDGVPSTLDVPASLKNLLNVLGEILSLHQESLDDTAMTRQLVADITSRLDRICGGGGESGVDSGLPEYEQTIFELNVADAVQAVVAPFASNIDDLEQWHSTQFIQQQAKLRDMLGEQLVSVLKTKSGLSFSVESTLAELTEQLEQFNQVLKGAVDLDVTRLATRLSNHSLAQNICREAVQTFVNDYAQWHTSIAFNDHAAGKLPESLLHSPETVASLM